jgi:hypothetical protein
MGEAEMTSTPRKTPTKGNKAKTTKSKKELDLYGEIALLKFENDTMRLKYKEYRSLLQKISSSFFSGVPLHEASYIRSVFISDALIEEVYEALRR